VISATASVPKREMIASSAGTIGGSAPSSSSVSALIRRPPASEPDCPPHRPSGASAHCRPRPSSFPWRGREGIVEIIGHDFAARSSWISSVLGGGSQGAGRQPRRRNQMDDGWSGPHPRRGQQDSFIDCSLAEKRCFEFRSAAPPTP
jgi:hypothetical protein